MNSIDALKLDFLHGPSFASLSKSWRNEKKMYKILALLNKPSQHFDVAEYKARDFSINKGNV